jgi:small subunit ribosomal protein S2
MYIEIKNEKFNINTEEMVKAGVVLGHKTSKTHPKMKQYILGTKNNIHIIDVQKSAKKLEEALQFIEKIVSENKVILFVGTKIQIKNLVKEIASDLNFPYINERWLGGTFTNFETIKKRINYFKELKNKINSEELFKYTKKEQAKIHKELKQLETKFGGMENLVNLPDAVFICDMKRDILAAREARRKKIPIIAIVDTNINPDLVDYPIPANDDAITSVKYILEKVKEVIKKVKNQD